MNETVVVALIGMAGSAIGSVLGIITSNKLTNYRIEQLEKKVDKHNSVIERVYKLERENAIQNEDIKELREKHMAS